MKNVKAANHSWIDLLMVKLTDLGNTGHYEQFYKETHIPWLTFAIILSRCPLKFNFKSIIGPNYFNKVMVSTFYD